jgi:hypothetical protein
MKTVVRTTGFVALTTLLWAVLMAILTGNPELTKVQLDADPQRVVDVRADADKLDAARLALHLDFVLLTLYGLTFVLLGVLLGGRGGGWWRIAGAAVIAAAITTCVCDVVENRRTLDVLPADATDVVTQSTLDALQSASYAKWAASVVTVGLATLVFVGRRRARIVVALAFMTVAAALVGLIGVLGQSRVTIQIYFALAGVVLPVVGLLFTIRPGKFLRGYRSRP